MLTSHEPGSTLSLDKKGRLKSLFAAKVEFVRGLIPLGLMHVHELSDEEVRSLVGERYERGEGYSGIRHGSNPGSVRLGGQRLPIRVPRVRGEEGEISLRAHAVRGG